MIERIIIIDGVDPQTFYGVNNANISLIRNLFPKLRVSARGNVVKVIGEEHETAEFEKKLKEIEAYASKYNKLTEEAIIDLARGEAPRRMDAEGVIIYAQNGRPVTPRNPNQARMVKSFSENDLTFALGPAGTGKTYIAIALAVRALKNKECRRIILSRPAVEAGEKLGFLPGDMKEKLDPYLQPLYDALNDMIPPARLAKYMEEGTVQIAPLAYMRGRTLDHAFVILDEAQNTTLPQIKMFLTRMGRNARFIVTGDVTQIDLPHRGDSGLMQAMRILRGVEGIGMVEFDRSDIVRHPLVKQIVDAFDRSAGREQAHADAAERKAGEPEADAR